MPAADYSLGEEAAFLVGSYGLIPDDWQAADLVAWLGVTPAGRWAAETCGLCVPRQNGKNGTLEMRELFGMVGLGERFLHTAHEVKTARKAFLRIASYFENPRQYPELAGLVKEIRRTNGQEAVVLTNGGSVEFIARSRSSGRGWTVDVLVCDEAQELTDEELAALLPTVSAGPRRSPQVILTGTPPDPQRRGPQGEVLRRVRMDGETGADTSLSWSDFGVVDGPMPDVDDETLWYATNPALGRRLAIEEVRRERRMMSAETFARERLGWWGDPEGDGEHPIPMSTWAKLLNAQAPRPPRACVWLDVSPDRRASCIAAAGQGSEPGRTLVLVQHAPGTLWVIDRLAQLAARDDVLEVVLHPASQAGALIPRLIEAGVTYRAATTAELAQACAGFQTAAEAGELEHVGQPELDAAVRNARTRYSGEGELWDRRDREIDISPLVAASGAAHAWAAQRGNDYDVGDSIA